MIRTLHSTMFLLILNIPEDSIYDHRFTFHNVSINTAVVDSVKLADYCFTFHNVSINTGISGSFIVISSFFTFHNVSINTDCPF